MNKILRIILLLSISLSTMAQVSLVKQFPVMPIAYFETFGNKILFNANSSRGTPELWVSDGKDTGTFLIPSVPALNQIASSFRCRIGNYIYWYTNGEIWKSDGTIAGTVKVKDGLPSCNYLVNLNGVLIFAGDDDLWRSDGTNAGTYKIKDDILPFVLERTAVYNGYLYFLGGTSASNKVWRTDGTAGGTTEVSNGGYTPLGFNVINDKLVYSAYQYYSYCSSNIPYTYPIRVLMKIEGSTASIITPVITCLPDNYETPFYNTSKFVKAGNYLYFKGQNSIPGYTTSNLWRTDGTIAGTIPLTNFQPGSSNERIDESFWDNFGENDFGFSSIFLFSARTSSAGVELWRSDGTVGGTVLLKDFVAGSDGSNPKEFKTINGITYFFAYSTGYGMELWKSDGTINGTLLVEPINRAGQNVPYERNGPHNEHLYGINMGNGYYFSGTYNGFSGLYVVCASPPPTLSATTTTSCAGDNITLSASGCNGLINWNTGATTSSIVVSPTSSTTYNATCTEANCSASIAATLSITVNPVPVITVNTANLCAGQSITLTASGVTSGIQWQKNGSTISGATSVTYTSTQAGKYSAIVTTTQCYSNEIIVKPIPALPTITSSASNSICAGQSTTLSVSNCTGTVSWHPGGSGTSILISPGTTTSYIAICTENTCPNSNAISITVNALPAAPVASVFDCNNTPTKVWEKKYGGTGIESPYNVLELSDGNLLWIGISSSSVSGDKTVANVGGDDAWVIKTDATGTTKIWEKIYGGASGDYPYVSIATGDGGAVIAMGSASGTTGSKTTANYGGNDIWVIKINSSGIITNQWTFGGSLEDTPRDIIQTSDGNYLIAAVSYSAGDTGNKNNTSAPRRDTGQGDFWLIKFDPTSTSPTGASIWQATYGGTLLDDPARVVETTSGDFLIAGSSKSSANTGNKTSVSHDGGSGQSDFWVVKINSDATQILWQQSYGGAKALSDASGQNYGDDNLASLTKSNTVGRYILGGSSKSQGSTGNKMSALKGDNDGWLVEINESDGTKVAEKSIGGASKDDFYEILTMPNGTGYWLAMRVGNVNSGDITATALGLTDIWVAEIDNNFSLAPRWNRRYGGAYEDGPRSTIVTSSGHLIVGGYQASSASNSNGIAQDYYAVKVSECTGANSITICSSANIPLYASGCNGTINWSNGSSGNSITVNTAGTYTATCTSFVTNCVSSVSNALVVNFANTNTPNSTDATICEGASTTLIATGCWGTFKWYSSNTGTAVLVNTAYYTTPVLNTPSIYYVSCTENNCESNRKAVTVNINARPSAPNVATPSPICVGAIRTLTATGCMGTVAWTGGLSGSSIIVSPNNTHNYRAACTNANFCTSDSSVAVNLTVNPIPSAPVITSGSCDDFLPKVWDKRFGGSNYEAVSSVIPTNDGGYLLGGYSKSGISGDKSQVSLGESDYWVVKIDANGTKLWDKRFGGNSFDGISSMIATNDGGYLLGGYSYSDISVDKSQASQGGCDYWIIKIDANGTKLWDKRFGGCDNDILRCMFSTNDGGYLLGGASSSNISGDKSQARHSFSSDYWIVKIDSNGSKIWDRTFGGDSIDDMSAILSTNDGGYLLGGSTLSNASGDISQTYNGSHDYWIVKIDANGSKLWEKRYGGNGIELFTTITATNDGGYLLGGLSGSDISGDVTQASKGNDDFWIVKIDANGSKVWDKRFGGSNFEHLYSVMPANGGGYLLAGWSGSDISWDVTQTSKGNDDFWILKIDANGSKVWDKRFGGNLSDVLFSMLPTNGGGYLLAGSSQSDISGDKSQSGQGVDDFWVIKANECNSNTICPNQSINLTATGCAGTINWSNGVSGSTININVAGTYTATCTVNNCISSQSNSFVISNVPTNLTLASTATNGVQKALETITSTQTIPISTNVSYQAGKSINLQGVFQAQPGSVFKAEIKGCSN